MKTNDTCTFVWMETFQRGGGAVEIHRENPITGVKRDNYYRENEISPSSYKRLFGALMALDGKLSIPYGVYDSTDEDECVLEYSHRPQGCAQWWDLDYHYAKMEDSDWCAQPYYGNAPRWDNERKCFSFPYAA